ncbi:MAG: prepilin-type N-terminal cleavage/methylation domain-containing protein [Finegoldia sp.]|nr:prepilin-type N-terminal cleavage/methylation domain-containing protein [Finegoldia sp.]
MNKKAKGFTLIEVLFALFIVSLCVLIYYPLLSNARNLEEKSYQEAYLLEDLDNSVEYLKNHDDMDRSLLHESSLININKEDHGDYESIQIEVTNGMISKDETIYKKK